MSGLMETQKIKQQFLNKAGGYEPNVSLFMMRMAMTETGFGREGLNKSSTKGLTQIDRGTFEFLRRHRTAGQVVRNNGITYESLGQDGEQQALLTRAALRTIPLPIPSDPAAQAAYWKVFWNTGSGAGRVEHFLKNAVGMEGEELERAVVEAESLAQKYGELKKAGILDGNQKAMLLARNMGLM